MWWRRAGQRRRLRLRRWRGRENSPSFGWAAAPSSAALQSPG
jgi:hypothetical protein